MKFTILFSTLLTLGSFAAFSQGKPKTKDVKISNFSLGGNGCPNGSVTHLVTNSKPNKPADTLIVTYDNLIVHSGPEIPTDENRRTCTLSFKVEYPEGYRFTFDNHEWMGYADVQGSEIYGELYTSLRVLSSPKNEKQSHVRYFEDFEGDYKIVGRFKKFVSSCFGSQILSLTTKAAIRGDTKKATGQMTVDQESGIVEQKIGMTWEKCD